MASAVPVFFECFNMPVQSFRRIEPWGATHPFWYYTAPLVCWILFVAWGSLTTSDNLPHFDFEQFDKVEHFASYGVLAVLLWRGWVRQGSSTLFAGLIVWIVASVWGVYLEFMQRLVGYRTFDLLDAAFNAGGALLGLLTWIALIRITRKSEDRTL
jgi:VanZ family protein